MMYSLSDSSADSPHFGWSRSAARTSFHQGTKRVPKLDSVVFQATYRGFLHRLWTFQSDQNRKPLGYILFGMEIILHVLALLHSADTNPSNQLLHAICLDLLPSTSSLRPLHLINGLGAFVLPMATCRARRLSSC